MLTIFRSNLHEEIERGEQLQDQLRSELSEVTVLL
jgi:hypothetical protein